MSSIGATYILPSHIPTTSVGGCTDSVTFQLTTQWSISHPKYNSGSTPYPFWNVPILSDFNVSLLKQRHHSTRASMWKKGHELFSVDSTVSPCIQWFHILRFSWPWIKVTKSKTWICHMLVTIYNYLHRSPGIANGNSDQYSCLGNSIDKGAWQSTVLGVIKSQTWLSMHEPHHNIHSIYIVLGTVSNLELCRVCSMICTYAIYVINLSILRF